MSSWDLYELMLRNNSLTNEVRDLAAAEALDGFLYGIQDDPAYQPDVKINKTYSPLVVSRTSTTECSIKAAPNTSINIGDIVECLGEHWLVTELYKDKIGLINGTMWICNHILHFQNHTPDTYTRYCVVDDGSYAKKSTDPDAFVMTNTYRVYIGLDDQTRKLFVDKRLAFGEIYDSDGKKKLEVYKIIGMDQTSHNHGRGSHLMMMTMQRDVFNPETDDIAAKVCDIVLGEPDKPVPPAQSGNTEIVGRDTIRIGASNVYTARFIDTSGEEITDITPIWNIKASGGIKYEINTPIFPPTVINPPDDPEDFWTSINICVPIMPDSSYTVIADGTEYLCTAKFADAPNGNTIAYIGNMKLLLQADGVEDEDIDPELDTGEPFIILGISGTAAQCYTLSPMTIAIYGEVVNKCDILPLMNVDDWAYSFKSPVALKDGDWIGARFEDNTYSAKIMTTTDETTHEDSLMAVFWRGESEVIAIGSTDGVEGMAWSVINERAPEEGYLANIYIGNIKAAEAIDVGPNVCKITVPLNPSLVGEIIEISARSPYGHYGGCSKKVEVITVG